VAASALLVLLVIYVPALQGPVGTTALEPGELAIVGIMALLPFAAVEAGKPLARRLGVSLTVGARSTQADADGPAENPHAGAPGC
jgi:hypothetical protein